MLALLTEAGLLGGNIRINSRVAEWVNNWLQRVSKSWPWPTLKILKTDIAISAGATSFMLGAGQNGVTQKIHRIFTPIFWNKSDFTSNGRILVRPRSDDALQVTTNAANRRGRPTTVLLHKDKNSSNVITKGCFTGYFDYVPDIALLLQVNYQVIPDKVVATDNTIELWYPNDRTLIQAAKTAIIDYNNNGFGRELDQALEHLASLVIEDRDTDGSSEGDNEEVGLDERFYPRSIRDSGSKLWRR